MLYGKTCYNVNVCRIRKRVVACAFSAMHIKYSLIKLG